MKTELLIVGSGPAGLQAAIHASRRKINVVVVGKISASSLKKAKVENYCCMELFSDGNNLLEKGQNQCRKFGVVFIEEDVLKAKRKEEGTFNVELESGKNVESKAIIIATGIARNKLDVKGENKYHGRGVSYCIECDAGFFKDKKVAVVGNGSAAANGALLMTLYAKEVVFVSKALTINEKLKLQLDASGIVHMKNHRLKEIEGDGNKVTSCLLENNQRIEIDGLFIELGAKGATELFRPVGVNFDKESFCYIETNKKQETNIKGIYAAGDICGEPFQLAKAVGEGCIAGISASDYIKADKTT